MKQFSLWIFFIVLIPREKTQKKTATTRHTSSVLSLKVAIIISCIVMFIFESVLTRLPQLKCIGLGSVRLSHLPLKMQ